MVAARFEGIHEALDEEAMKLVEDKKKKLEIELKAHSAILLSLRDEDQIQGATMEKGFYQKKEGHFRDECFALKAKLKRDSQQLGTRNHGEADLVDGCETADVLVAPSSDSSGELVLDSGYSFHMTPNRELLSSFLEEHSGTVLLSNNKACAI
uniref:Uncharacterized protein n=1 Tax=Cannabis sativa TaxID=3483 RepID=A0A803Q0Y0_CANSA